MLVVALPAVSACGRASTAAKAKGEACAAVTDIRTQVDAIRALPVSAASIGAPRDINALAAIGPVLETSFDTEFAGVRC